ncbi:putative cytochrome P450 301a1, mitochondrial, partial [Stegodyphus mimosarum]
MQDKYFKDAHLFYPERWEKARVPLVSSPFGYGPRSCIGMRFARMELYLATAKLVRNYIISYHHEEIDSVTRLINVPDKPLRLKFKKVPQ